MADSTKERTQAEAQFKKTQKQKEGAEAMAAYVADAHAVRAKTARLRELRLAKEASDKAVKNKPVEKAKKPQLDFDVQDHSWSLTARDGNWGLGGPVGGCAVRRPSGPGSQYAVRASFFRRCCSVAGEIGGASFIA